MNPILPTEEELKDWREDCWGGSPLELCLNLIDEQRKEIERLCEPGPEAPGDQEDCATPCFWCEGILMGDFGVTGHAEDCAWVKGMARLGVQSTQQPQELHPDALPADQQSKQHTGGDFSGGEA